MTYGISGIGLDPTYGLGGTGTYSSYYNNLSNMNYMNGMGGYNTMFGSGTGMYGTGTGMYGMGTTGMYGGMYGGMMNPLYFSTLQNQMEENNLTHAQNMHTILTNNEVTSSRETDSALIQKIMINGDLTHDVTNLNEKLKESDLQGFCEEFDKLKTKIYNSYSKEIQSFGGGKNPNDTANYIIEMLYSKIISATTGSPANLRDDIDKYGEGALSNGIMQGFRSGHNNYNVDDVKNHCFGLRIDNKRSKDMQTTVGKGIGTTASFAEKGAIGAITATAATAGTLCVAKGGAKLFNKNVNAFKGKGRWYGFAAAVGTLAGIGLDAIWKASAA